MKKIPLILLTKLGIFLFPVWVLYSFLDIFLEIVKNPISIGAFLFYLLLPLYLVGYFLYIKFFWKIMPELEKHID